MNDRKRISREFGIIEFVAISTLLIPKAGLNMRGIPLTLNLFLVGAIILITIVKYFSFFDLNHIIILSMIIPWLLVCMFRSNALIESQTLKFGSIYWFLFVPFFWVATYCLKKANRCISPKLLIYCSFGTSLFGIAQYIWGLNFLKIPGITIAIGDSYEHKNLNIFEAYSSVGTKIPSTFQSGNIWGQCSALILIWIVVFKIWKEYDSKLLQILTIASPSIAVFLSLSRTAVFAVVSSLVLYAIGNLRRFLSPIFFLIFFLLLVLSNSTLSLGRYSLESFTNSAGRSAQWSIGINNFSLIDWAIGRSNIMPNSAYHMEGILGLFGQVGIIGFSLLLLLWINIFTKDLNWIGFGVLLCLIFDSTYISPPLLLVPGILLLVKKT